jgi:hypothetical protein
VRSATVERDYWLVRPAHAAPPPLHATTRAYHRLGNLINPDGFCCSSTPARVRVLKGAGLYSG